MTPKSTAEPGLREVTALFAGSFNPFTIGHADIVERALSLFDRVVIGVGHNNAKPAPTHNIDTIERLYADNDRVRVAAYSGLTADFAAEIGATALVRGVRSAKDFEYERDMADINRQLSGLETVILYSRPELSAISSSVVRELQSFGRDITEYLPPLKEE